MAANSELVAILRDAFASRRLLRMRFEFAARKVHKLSG
jgi:hypothetical protein